MRKWQRVIYSNYDIEITAREVLFSIVIFFIMLTIGFFISEKISSKADERNQEYYQAVKISDDSEVFQYGMRTNVGNAFVHGTLEAVGPVSYPELCGEYAYIEKVEERYTAHTRTVTHSNGKTTYTTVETYYTWDRYGSENRHCKNIRFLGVDFEYGKIGFPSARLIETIKKSSKVRYKYYACDISYTGSIYADLRNGTISHAVFINGASTEEAVKYMEDQGIAGVVAFWVFWIALTGAAIYGFYYLENNWLED